MTLWTFWVLCYPSFIFCLWRCKKCWINFSRLLLREFPFLPSIWDRLNHVSKLCVPVVWIMYVHWYRKKTVIKYINFTYFPGEVISRKRTVSRVSGESHENLCEQLAYRKSPSKKIRENYSIFYTVCCFFNIWWTRFLPAGIRCSSSTLQTESSERNSNGLNLFSKFLFLGQGIFFLLLNEVPFTTYACHFISYTSK